MPHRLPPRSRTAGLPVSRRSSPFRSAEPARPLCEKPKDHSGNEAATPSLIEALGDQRIDAKAPTEAVKRKDDLQHEQEEIGPRPFSGRVVEAEPQIEDLQRADGPPEADEYAEDERDRGQDFEAVDGRRE